LKSLQILTALTELRRFYDFSKIGPLVNISLAVKSGTLFRSQLCVR